MPSLTNRLKLALPNGNEYVNRAVLNKIFEDIDRLVMLQADFNTAKKEIDDNLAKKVSKSGDTMSGQLKFDKSGTGVIWKDDVNMDYGLVTESDGKRLIMQDWKRKKTLMSNDDSGFIVNADNLLKKSGDIMTGLLTFPVGAGIPNRGLEWKEGADRLWTIESSQNDLLFHNYKDNKQIFKYNRAANLFTVSAETNLLKKTGDAMTGHLEFRTNKELQFKKDDGTSLAGIAVDNNGDWFAWNHPGNKYLWKLDGKTGEFFVNANNLVSKGGDNLTGDFAYYNPNPMQFRPHDKKWWLINTNQEGLKFIPSGTTNKDDWQWAKAIWINPEGEVNTQGVKVKGERVLTTSDAEEKIPSRSGKDENGIFTTYEEMQEDGKLWKRSVLSSPDTDGNYLVRTVTYYKDGVSYKTKIFDLKYDEDGDFVKAVPR